MSEGELALSAGIARLETQMELIHEIRAELLLIKARVNLLPEKFPCDVHHERHEILAERISDIESWRKDLWGKLFAFVGTLIVVVQSVLHLASNTKK